jgi:hypothetical protein
MSAHFPLHSVQSTARRHIEVSSPQVYVLRRPFGVVGILLVAVCCIFGSSLEVIAQTSPVSVATYHNNNYRSGANLQETLLNSSNVNSNVFGKLGAFAVDDWIVAQPLYVPNVNTVCGTYSIIIVATLNNSVYAFAANGNSNPCSNGQKYIWFYNNPAEPPTNYGGLCEDSGYDTAVHLGAGIVATPVVDITAGLAYFVTKTGDQNTSALNLHAVDITSGANKTTVTINPQVTGANYLPFYQMARAGLLLDKAKGLVTVALGSTGCQAPPEPIQHTPNPNNHGFIVAFNIAGLTVAGAFATTGPPNNASGTNNGGPWQGGGGITEDTNGIYFATAEALFDGTNNWGDSVLRLSNDGKATFADSFTPYDQAALATNDQDIGSVGPILIDNTNPVGHFLIASGKRGESYLINRGGMGGYCPPPTCSSTTGNTNIVEDVVFPSNITTTPCATGGGAGQICRMTPPVYWNTSTTSSALGYVYFPHFNHDILVYSLGPGSGTGPDCPVNKGPIALSCDPVAQTGIGKVSFGSPSVSANCATAGTCGTTGIVWAVGTTPSQTGNVAALYAFNALPPGGNANLATLFNSGTGTDTLGGLTDHFATPTIANGRVYVGTHSQLVVYGCRKTHPNCI